ncbi:hypoxia induced protein conserved region-domain-containing protein, partial [Mycotypha africana]|uniref:hypoxia induced protein conserved region-domain-containing protein n=1 Tax=Mycotypha africana TaxID=64632 RepID=UPI002301E526
QQYSNEQMERMRAAMGHDSETPLQKLKAKFQEEPLVPAGAALTTFALVAAAYGVKKGNRAFTNNMFRLRVGAQAFTVLAMVGGSVYFQYKKNQE